MVWFLLGVICGAAAVAGAWLVHSCFARRLGGRARETFAAAATEALDANARRLAEMAEVTLEAKRKLIDQSIAALNEQLERVRASLRQVEAERQRHYGELTERLAALGATTESLRKALAGSQRIGEWGERMTEDVLRLAGMQEGINYLKQSMAAAEEGKPDFTFMLPNGLVVNMDVKFPLQKCLEYLDATDDEQRKVKAKEFIAALRKHIRDVAGRGYISPAAGTVDYVIVFIPNEQVFSLALELEPDIMDHALKLRVVLTGPLTLYAMLVVIRQAAENANIMKTADEVIALLAVFEKQWQKFKETMDRMGSRLDDAKREYDTLVGTRARALDRPLTKIEELRTTQGLGSAGGDEPDSKEP